MVYFSVHITFNEIILLQKNLSSEYYCLFRTELEPDFYYGAVAEEAFHLLLHALAAETLEQLEYLNEFEFHTILAKDKLTFIGNRKLIE